MKTSKAMIEKIGEFEGLSLIAYKCPAGVPTIGYGSTRFNGKPVVLGMKITKEQALEQLAKDVETFEKQVSSVVKVSLTQHQFDALVSFCYNVGIGNLKSSSLLRKVNMNPNDSSIRANFAAWNKAGGKVLNGLIRRREKEADWYFTKD